jgi:hypothetical protein
LAVIFWKFSKPNLHLKEFCKWLKWKGWNFFVSANFFGTLIFVNLPRFLSIHLYFFFHFANENCRGFVCMDTNWQISSFFGEKDHLHNGHKCKKVLPLDSNGFLLISVCLSLCLSVCLSHSIFFYQYSYLSTWYYCVSFWKASVNPVSLSIVPYVCIRLKYLFICTFLLLSTYFNYDCFLAILIIVLFAFFISFRCCLFSVRFISVYT